MTQVTVVWKQERGNPDLQASERFTEYKVESAFIENGFLNLRGEAGDKTTHISVDQIALWTEEASN